MHVHVALKLGYFKVALLSVALSRGAASGCYAKQITFIGKSSMHGLCILMLQSTLEGVLENEYC